MGGEEKEMRQEGNAGFKRVALRMLLFALFGMLMEVFFGSIGNVVNGEWNARGSTSPWMMIDYGILGVAVGPISVWLKKRRIPLVLRAGVYAAGIFFVEYVSGVIFTAAGLRIWNYSHLPLNLHGQITLVYTPFWWGLGLGLEWLYRKIDMMAGVLAAGEGTKET